MRMVISLLLTLTIAATVPTVFAQNESDGEPSIRKTEDEKTEDERDRAAQPGDRAPEQRTKTRSTPSFRPSERIRADQAVAFPADI